MSGGYAASQGRSVYPATRGSCQSGTAGAVVVDCGAVVGVDVVGDGVGVELIVTWLNGSFGLAHGKTTRKSNITVANISTRQPRSLPGMPPGILRQIHPYISGALDAVAVECLREPRGLGDR